jgi:hypothetical protein
MTPSEESIIDAHILVASNLRTTSIGYKALVSLLKHGNLLTYAFKDYSIFVNFTRVLDHLSLDYEFVTYGLQLNENAKLKYHQNVMNRKAQEFSPAYQPG